MVYSLPSVICNNSVIHKHSCSADLQVYLLPWNLSWANSIQFTCSPPASTWSSQLCLSLQLISTHIELPIKILYAFWEIVKDFVTVRCYYNNHQAAGPPFLSCSWLTIQYIHSYYTYLKANCICHLRKWYAAVTIDTVLQSYSLL
jgi:hypothetical protein